MHYFLYPDKDATLYSIEPTQNSGMDEIIEISKVISDVVNNSRIVIKFDITDFSSSIASTFITGSYNVYLNLYTCEAKEIPIDYTLWIYPVSQSWDMGLGKYADNPFYSGSVSWQYRDGSTEWISGTLAGGSYYSGSTQIASQSYSYNRTDVRANVTDIFNNWLSGTITNEGFLLKRSDADESSSLELGELKFFSKETHTIYAPKLEIVWDDSSFVTGSLTALTDENITLYMKGLKKEYKVDSLAKYRVIGRKTYPIKAYYTSSFTSSIYNTVKYLPTASYYSIVDDVTGETIVPFGSYSKLSCDSDGNYFRLKLNTFEPERYYKIIYKTLDSSDNEKLFDDNFVFKIVR